jgi:hypothetical protein
MDRNKLPLHIHYLGVPSGAPKAISMPVVDSSQTVHLSCTEINIISKQSETSFHLTHVTFEYPSGASKMISKPMVRSAQTVHLFGTETNTISKQTENKLPHYIHYLGVP